MSHPVAFGIRMRLSGNIVDAETGKPIPNVSLVSENLADMAGTWTRDVLRTNADDDGHFRLTGVPRGEGSTFLARPNGDQPYFPRVVNVPNPTGLGPAEMKIELHRGLWIKGRVTDMKTGEPIRSANIEYIPLLANRRAQTLPEFSEQGMGTIQIDCRSAADGTFRLVGLPGPGIVAGTSSFKSYHYGIGFEAIDDSMRK